MEDQVSYSKRPLWQWIAIYAVVGVVIYAAIYFLFIAKKSSYVNPNSATVSPTQSANSTIAEASIFLTPTGFNPSSLTIKTGATVIWTNQSGAPGNISSDPHPIHTDYPPLNLGNFDAGATLSLSFPAPGTYKYHNHLQPSQSGTIIVK